MKYVMSDIHGNYTKFLKMMKKINLTENDELYILGDFTDRGTQSFNILGYILKHENIHLLQGNHEQFLLEYYETKDSWMWLYNGGKKTLEHFNQKTHEQQEFIYNYLKTRPAYVIVDDKYLLSHAGVYVPNGFEDYTVDKLVDMLGDNFLWHRFTINNERQYKHYTQICGHNRVQSIEYSDEAKIIKRDGFIYIDCGVDLKNGKLACLRLDDMCEFYV